MTLFKRRIKVKRKPNVPKPPQAAGLKEKDTFAAIAAAIYLYFQEQHDFEKFALTIKRIDKIYSPWSSKIYGLRKSPR